MQPHDAEQNYNYQKVKSRGLGWKMKTVLTMAGLMTLEAVLPTRVLAEDKTDSNPNAARTKKANTEYVSNLRYKLVDETLLTKYGMRLKDHPELKVQTDDLVTSEQINYQLEKLVGKNLGEKDLYEKVIAADAIADKSLTEEALMEIKNNLNVDTIAALNVNSPIKNVPREDLEFNSGYGPRKLFGRDFHAGTDVRIKAGKTIINPVIGGATFIKAYKTKKGGTWVIELDAGDGFVIKAMDVKPNKKLKSGDFIGEGQDFAVVVNPKKGDESTGAHLHFQVEKDGKPINSTKILRSGEYVETATTLYGKVISQKLATALQKAETVDDLNKIEKTIKHKSNIFSVTWTKLRKVMRSISAKHEGDKVMEHDTNGKPSFRGINKGAHPGEYSENLTLNDAARILAKDASFLKGKKATPAMLLAVANAAALNPNSAERFFYQAGGNTDEQNPELVVQLTDQRCENLAKKKKYRYVRKAWQTRNKNVLAEVQKLQAQDDPLQDVLYQTEKAEYDSVMQKLDEQKFEVFAEQHKDAKEILMNDAKEFDQAALFLDMAPAITLPKTDDRYIAMLEPSVIQSTASKEFSEQKRIVTDYYTPHGLSVKKANRVLGALTV